MQGAIFGRRRNTAVGCVVNFVTILVVYFIICSNTVCEKNDLFSAVLTVVTKVMLYIEVKCSYVPMSYMNIFYSK